MLFFFFFFCVLISGRKFNCSVKQFENFFFVFLNQFQVKNMRRVQITRTIVQPPTVIVNPPVTHTVVQTVPPPPQTVTHVVTNAPIPTYTNTYVQVVCTLLLIFRFY